MTDTLGIRYTPSGYPLLLPGDDGDALVDALVKDDYPEEFCLSERFEPEFIAALMAAGFLVMSSRWPVGGYLLLPKMHRERAVLDFPALHESRSVRRRLGRYELRPDADFQRILERCVAVHGEEWLTPPLQSALLDLRRIGTAGADRAAASVRPLSFGLYRDGRLVAGEFGVSSGGVYTSYSGYRDEDSAGTAQLILTGRALRDAGYAFWDLGMPLDYKARLGARSLDRETFISRFRSARLIRPRFPEY